MATRNFKDFENPTEALAFFTKMMSTPGFSGFFGGMPFPKKERSPYLDLGEGYELRPTEIFTEEGKVVETTEQYFNLYHNGLKMLDLVFRKGGMCNGFKDGYCSLIHYKLKEKHTEERHGFDFGTHVIINMLGNIVLSSHSITDYPNHIGGHLGSSKGYIYDLRTGKAIAPKTSTSIKGTKSIIIEHRYDWETKEVNPALPLGIYQIDLETCELLKIDDIK